MLTGKVPTPLELARPRVVLTLGSFDGVHLGHQAIIGKTLALADSLRATPALLTFDPLPAQLIYPDFTYILTPPAEKIRLLAELGIELVHILRFDEKLQNTGPEEFVKSFILEPFHPVAIVIGADHRFGRMGRGDAALLRRLLEPESIKVEVVTQFKFLGEPVSSTRIREHLLLGHVRLARELLGRPYALTGRVITGTGTGRLLGFPTINIQPTESEKLIPADGVYAVLAEITSKSRIGSQKSAMFKALLNIGHRPTFHGDKRTIEVHLLDDSSLATHHSPLITSVTVHFIERIRPERKFPSPQALADQIAQDVLVGRRLLTD